MVKRIQNLARGCLMLDLRGAAIERFLNLCGIHGVSLWGVRTLDVDHYTAWVSVAGYAALRPYARKTGCRLRVLKKRGIPLAAKQLTRRRMLWCGLLTAVVLVWFLSGFVWTIRVEGCEQLSEREVLMLLEQAGLKTGVRKKNLHINDMKNSVMLSADKVSYFTVNFQGTKAIVQVWERRHPEEKPSEPKPCDVVSGLTGVITAIRVKTGLAAVKVGDTVQAGEIIARGTIVNENDHTDVTLLHAEAEIDLRTWYTLRIVVPSELSVLTPKKVVTSRRALLLGRQRIPFGRIEKKELSWYDKQINIRYLDLHEDFHWPIGRVTETLSICHAQPAALDIEALAVVLETRMKETFLAEKPDAQILSADFSLETSPQGAWLGILNMEMLETTGIEFPIG